MQNKNYIDISLWHSDPSALSFQLIVYLCFSATLTVHSNWILTAGGWLHALLVWQRHKVPSAATVHFSHLLTWDSWRLCVHPNPMRPAQTAGGLLLSSLGLLWDPSHYTWCNEALYLCSSPVNSERSFCQRSPLHKKSSLNLQYVVPSTQFFKKKKSIYLFLAVLGLRCCVQAFSSCGKQGLLFVAVRGLLIVVASLVVEQGL